jgi:putative inorganic carbon (HCO3(-)) transporter
VGANLLGAALRGKLRLDSGTAKTEALSEAPSLGGRARRPGWLAALKRVATWVAEHELWLLAVVVPVLMATNRTPPRLTLAALALVPVGWVARKVAFGHLTYPTPLDFPIAPLFLAIMLSLYASVDLDTSMIGLHKIIAEVALFYGIVNGLRTPRAIRLFTVLFLLVGLAAAGASLLVMHRAPGKFPLLSPLYSFLPTVVPRSVNANYIAGTVVLFLPLSLSLLLFGPRMVSRFVSGPIFLVLGGTLALTQSRSVLAGVVIALLLLAVWRSRWFLLGIPVLAGVGWVLVQRVGIEELMGPLTFMDTAVNSLQGRLELWQRAIYIMQDFPYTGISIGTFDSVVDVMYPLFLIGPDAMVFHAHNLYLQTGAEFGIPGLVAYLGLLVAFGLTTWAILRSPASGKGFRAVAIGLLCGLVAHLVYGLTDAIVLANKTGTFIWAAFGLVVAIRRVMDEPPIAASDAESVADGW